MKASGGENAKEFARICEEVTLEWGAWMAGGSKEVGEGQTMFTLTQDRPPISLIVLIRSSEAGKSHHLGTHGSRINQSCQNCLITYA